MHDTGERFVVRVDPDLLPFIPGYLANRRRDVQTAMTALAQGDYEAIRVVGHQMKGSGAGYGFDRLTDIGGALQDAAMSADVALIRRCVAELVAYLDRVDVAT